MTALPEWSLPPVPGIVWDRSLQPILDEIGAPLHIHGVLAHHPELLTAWWPLRTHLVGASALDADVRELVILRTAVLTESTYEWLHHAHRGRAAGLSQDAIRRVREGPFASGWDDRQRVAVAAVDELFDTGALSKETGELVEARLGTPGLLDLLFTVGIYRMIASIIATAELPDDDLPLED